MNATLDVTDQGRKPQPIEFVVVITSYNNEKFYERNLDTLVNQKLEWPYEVVYVNDCSHDRTGPLVDEYIKEHKLENLVRVIHNEQNVGALENLYNVIHACPDHKIIVTIDGDDFTAGDHILARIAKEYEDENTWMTYGQLAYYPENCGSFCEEIPAWVKETNSFRQYKWVTSQPRTFRAGLFKRIKKEDLLYEGKFYPMAWDLAIMYPMLEMAAKGHIRFIPDVLYYYNHHNPISDHNKNKDLQMKMTMDVVNKKPYKALESLD